MNPLAVVLHVLAGRARQRGRYAIYLTAAMTGWRIARRVMSTGQHTLLRFEVKPGEIYEIRGLRRGR